MNTPRATYRLQFHRGFTLRDTLSLVPYLSALGVSHVYASPLLKARPGSTHGYDTCDCSLLNPEIGIEAELESLVATLREHGMGLVLDIVPNHMGIGGRENPWWWDVLKHGCGSRFASYFDIDWETTTPDLRGKVLVPVLGDEFERILARGELQLASTDREIVVRYFDHCFPVNPASLASIDSARSDILTRLNADPESLRAVLEQQHYRLAFWRRGDSELNYRRFFTITDLAGLRVEDPAVFEATHQRVLDWHRRGWIDGMRIDHPDGLRDPEAYLQRLREAAPGAWIVVEKILEHGESLPTRWPIAGTTGYDFLNCAGGVFLDPAGQRPLTDFYAAFTGESTDYAAFVRENKLRILHESLVAEIARLAPLLRAIASSIEPAPAFNLEQLRDALIELISCFPVYRTYVRPAEQQVGEDDVRQVETAIAAARQARSELPPSSFDLLRDLLLLRIQTPDSAEFVMRFQQLTGPAMAKGVEDTTFYCFNRFVALNEVGGDPSQFGTSVDEFHRACIEARQQWPLAMLASSTHDTKRSEDVRARLAVLSEMPVEWPAAVRRWSDLNAGRRRNDLPDRNAEYLFYQTIVGAWPLSLERAQSYLQKAVREAKQHTNWTDGNVAYEEALASFVTAALSDAEFSTDVERFVAPLIECGYLNSLAQTLLKLTAPGVPDIYQGTELWDLSLVDPDNRRPVDFEKRRRLLGEAASLDLDAIWKRRHDGLPKLWLIQQILAWRRDNPDLFDASARYLPLSPINSRHAHVCAFARAVDSRQIIVVVPRLVYQLTDGGRHLPLGSEVWNDTAIVLAGTAVDLAYRNLFTGEQLMPEKLGGKPQLALSRILNRFPVAVLISE